MASLVRKPMDSLDKEFEQMSRRLFGPILKGRDISDVVADIWQPFEVYRGINIKDEERQYLIECSLPGYAKEHVDVMLEPNELRVIATREERTEKDGYRHYETGRYENRFHPAQFGMDAFPNTGIEATFANGMLSMRIPKPEPVKETPKPEPVKVPIV